MDDPQRPRQGPRPAIGRPHWTAFAAIGVGLVVLAAVLTFALRGNGGGALASAPATATSPPSCSTRDGKLVADLVGRYAQQWDDADELAGSLSRIAMAPQVAELQKIRREVQAQEYPECGARAQRLLVKSMDASINGYLAFLRQEPDTEVAAWFAVARVAQQDFAVALAQLSGVPSAAPSPTATVRR